MGFVFRIFLRVSSMMDGGREDNSFFLAMSTIKSVNERYFIWDEGDDVEKEIFLVMVVRDIYRTIMLWL